MRTRRPFYRSRPGSVLLISTLVLIAIGFVIPYLPFMAVFGFVPLSGSVLLAVATITVLYVLSTETLKQRFYRVPA